MDIAGSHQHLVLKTEIAGVPSVIRDRNLKKKNDMKTITKYYRKAIQVSCLIIGVVLFSQCTVIKPGYNGVLNRPLGNGLKTDKIYQDGFAARGFFTNIIKYDVRLNSYQEKIDILTADELHTTIALSVMIKPKSEELPSLILEIGEDYYENIVKPNFYSVTRGVMASYNYEEISAKSLEIEKVIYGELEKRLQGKHIILDKVTLDHIMYSPVVTDATDQKLATKQKLEQKSIEMKIAEKEADIQRISAKGQRDAQKIIDEGLTKRYLQFKSLEVQDKLAKSDNAKFFFIPIGKDGLPIIVDAGAE